MFHELCHLSNVLAMNKKSASRCNRSRQPLYFLPVYSTTIDDMLLRRPFSSIIFAFSDFASEVYHERVIDNDV